MATTFLSIAEKKDDSGRNSFNFQFFKPVLGFKMSAAYLGIRGGFAESRLRMMCKYFYYYYYYILFCIQ